MLSFFLTLFLVPAGLLCVWPLVARWLGRDDLLTALSALGVSGGALSLWMFALAWSGVLSVWGVLGLVVLAWGAGYALNRDWFRLVWLRAASRQVWEQMRKLDVGGIALLVMALSLAVVLISNVYYPFLADDTLSRYALYARLIYEHRDLPAEIQGSPLLIPLNFAYVWLVGNTINEHLAKLVPFAFAAGMMGGTVLLGRRLAGRLNGLVAGAMLAVTPLFAKWAVTGYTDIPTGFYVTLAAVYALLWAEIGAPKHALLAGTMTGLALWTKQSALTIVASLVGVAVLRALRERRARAGLAGLVPLLAPVLVIAGPWYLRNLMLGGMSSVLELPGSFHTLGVRPRLVGLLPALQYPAEFGVGLVPFYALGVVLALWRGITQGWAALRGRGEWPLADLVGLAVMVPYWLAWWTHYSFDSRFLLLVTPTYAAWAAWPLAWLIERRGWGERLHHWPALALAGLLLIVGLRSDLGAVWYAVTQPFASYGEKLERTKGDLYPTAVWLGENLEPDDRVLSMDTRLRYYLTAYHVSTGYLLTFEDIAYYDYVIDASGTVQIYRALGWTDSDYWQHRGDPMYFEEVFVGGTGSQVYRVLPTVAQEVE